MPSPSSADKIVIEELAVVAASAESFPKVYYKTRKELEGVYPSTPQQGKGLTEEVLATRNRQTQEACV